jgi:hypothetical protein
LRNAEIRITIRRIDYHSPRRYALFSSIDGFNGGAEVFDTGRFTDETDREFVFKLPDAAAYSNLTSAVTFRLVGYSGQYGGHKTSLRAFKLTADLATLPPFARWKADHGIPSTAPDDSDTDNDLIPLLLEYGLNLDPQATSSNGLPSGGLTNGFLTLTYTRVKAATDINYTAEVTGALTNSWSSSLDDVEQAWHVFDLGDSEAVTARDKSSASNTASRFMRLSVTQP